MLMFFTSGTTGYPKIAAHSYTYPLGHYITAKYWHGVSDNGLHFTISETGWGKALWGKIYGQWLCEGAVFTSCRCSRNIRSRPSARHPRFFEC